ncbi:MAG: hypothetical protein QXW26_04730 [Candidatus Nitrosocaldus sp.]
MVEYDILGIKVWIPDFNDLYNFIVKPLVEFFAPVAAFFSSLSDQVLSSLNSFIDIISKSWDSLTLTISQVINDALSKVFEVGGALSSLVVRTINEGLPQIAYFLDTTLSDFAKFLTEFLNSMINNIVSQATSFATELHNLMNQQVLPSLSAIADATTTIHQSILNFIPFAENTLNTVASYVLSINQNISEVVGGAFADVGNAFYAGIGQLGNYLMGIWQSFLDTLKTYVAEPAMQLIDGFISYLNAQLDNFVNFIPSLFTITKEEAIISPFSVITKTIQALLGTGASIAIPLTFAELIHPLKEMGFNQLAAYVWDLADFKNVGSIILGTLTSVALASPLRHGLNFLYRPALPPLSQVDQILFEGNMSEEQWRQFYQLYGWEDRYIDMWAKSRYIKPSDRILLDILQTPGIADEWVKQKFREKGFSDYDVEMLIIYGYRRKIQDEINRVRTALNSAYETGIITEQEYMLQLKGLGFSDIEVIWSLYAANIITERKRTEERVRAAVSAFMKYLIDEDELRDILSKLIVDVNRINNIIELAKFKREPSKKPKPELQRSLTATQILNVYKLAIITEDQARQMLKVLKYADDAIDLMIASVKAKLQESEVE